MGRRKFSREFKLEAVRLIKEQGISYAQARRDLGVHESVLRRWVNQADEAGSQAFPGKGRMRPADADVARLQRDLRRVTAERDILKKALGYFAKEPK
jgi:transposase